jgi:hypothetical protein
LCAQSGQLFILLETYMVLGLDLLSHNVLKIGFQEGLDNPPYLFSFAGIFGRIVTFLYLKTGNHRLIEWLSRCP